MARRKLPPRQRDKAKPRGYYAKLVAMANPGSTPPEVAQARAFLAANP